MFVFLVSRRTLPLKCEVAFDDAGTDVMIHYSHCIFAVLLP